jgi:hypothetical protein
MLILLQKMAGGDANNLTFYHFAAIRKGSNTFDGNIF